MFDKDDGDYQYEECTYVLNKYGKMLIMIRYNWNTYVRARCNRNLLNVVYILVTNVTRNVQMLIINACQVCMNAFIYIFLNNLLKN